jgi:hypothetical protein
MRSIEEIATDVFNGLSVPEAEQRAFYDFYGETKAAAYGIRMAAPAGEETEEVIAPAPDAPVTMETQLPPPAPVAPPRTPRKQTAKKETK